MIEINEIKPAVLQASARPLYTILSEEQRKKPSFLDDFLLFQRDESNHHVRLNSLVLHVRNAIVDYGSHMSHLSESVSESVNAALDAASNAANSAEIATEAANQALNAVSAGVVDDAKVSESTTFSSSKIVADFATKGDVLSALTNVAHTNRVPIVLTRGEILLANTYYSLAPENVNSIFSLPANPSDGDEIEIIDDARVWAEKLPILERNHKTINGLAEDLTLNIKGVRIFCKYRNNNWSITT